MQHVFVGRAEVQDCVCIAAELLLEAAELAVRQVLCDDLVKV